MLGLSVTTGLATVVVVVAGRTVTEGMLGLSVTTGLATVVVVAPVPGLIGVKVAGGMVGTKVNVGRATDVDV